MVYQKSSKAKRPEAFAEVPLYNTPDGSVQAVSRRIKYKEQGVTEFTSDERMKVVKLEITGVGKSLGQCERRTIT